MVVTCGHLCTEDLCRIQGMIELKQLLLFQKPIMRVKNNFQYKYVSLHISRLCDISSK